MAAISTQETTWHRAIHHPVSLLGFAILVSGSVVGNSVVGNIAISKMTNVVSAKEESVEREMFSTAEETEPLSGKAAQAAAVEKYREIEPQGRFYRMLQFGWVMNGVGFLLIFGGVFIEI